MMIFSSSSRLVQVLHVNNNSQVHAGDHILSLDDSDEQNELRRIYSLRHSLEIIERNDSPERAAARRRILELSLDTARSYEDFLRRATAIAELRYQNNEIPELDVIQIRAELVEASSQREKSERRIEEFDALLQDSRSLTAVSRDQINNDEQDVRQRMTNLAIRAPLAGIVSLSCGVGSFAEMGSVVAEIV